MKEYAAMFFCAAFRILRRGNLMIELFHRPFRLQLDQSAYMRLELIVIHDRTINFIQTIVRFLTFAAAIKSGNMPVFHNIFAACGGKAQRAE